jgi:FtsP/CotA-like multicopper oxidase with cupredoxin domain
LTLINGQLRPTINMVNKNPYILKIINAGSGEPLYINFPTSAISCAGSVIAVDGVYLKARWDRTTVNLPPGSRVDIEMFCDFTGNS